MIFIKGVITHMPLKLQDVLTQKMILSQEMLQSLNILRCSTEELHSLLKAKQEENPFLKVQFKRADHIELLSNGEESTGEFTQQIMEQLLHVNVSKRLTYIMKLILADLSEIGFLTQSPKEMAEISFLQ